MKGGLSAEAATRLSTKNVLKVPLNRLWITPRSAANLERSGKLIRVLALVRGGFNKATHVALPCIFPHAEVDTIAPRM